jgi:hypothetical protein
MPEDFFDELIGKKSDELDDILDKIKNRWETDLTRSLWDDNWMLPKEERDEEPPQQDVPRRANRSRKKYKGNRKRK